MHCTHVFVFYTYIQGMIILQNTHILSRGSTCSKTDMFSTIHYFSTGVTVKRSGPSNVVLL